MRCLHGLEIFFLLFVHDSLAVFVCARADALHDSTRRVLSISVVGQQMVAAEAKRFLGTFELKEFGIRGDVYNS